MTNYTLIHMYEKKSQSPNTGLSKMHKHTHVSLTHGLYYSLYLRKHAYLQTWRNTLESLGTGRLFKKASVRRAVTERGLATHHLPSQKKRKKRDG